MKKINFWQCLFSRGILQSMFQRTNMLRRVSVNCTCNAKIVYQKDISEDSGDEDLPEIVKFASDKCIKYSSYISSKTVKLPFKSRKSLVSRINMREIHLKREASIPLVLEKMLSQHVLQEHKDVHLSEHEVTEVNLPYATVEDINIEDLNVNTTEQEREINWNNSQLSVLEDVKSRMQAYGAGLLQAPKSSIENSETEEFVSFRELDSDYESEEDHMEYGSCDPDVPISKISCGGCGAKLHCQQHALPGFLPKEVFMGLNKGELRSTICQRCYMLKNHNMALNVRVSPDLYPKLLEPIKNAKALVIILIDLLDVPCSIWPNIISIVGTRRPVVVVGNKVDLLPADGKNHLRRIKESLVAAVEKTSLGRANIKHTALVSAHTGFGIENLITKVQNSWGSKGDVYIIGCTNTGKSTLFNALLGSDMCKTKASDLMLRATTSPWPGTTLNMLKFPLLRPSGHRLYLRTMRLRELQKQENMKIHEKYTTSVSVATLSGYIGRTFAESEPTETLDPFSAKFTSISKDSLKIAGITESHPMFSDGKWCYDTPGTVQPDQLINLLTHEELMEVLPRELIRPRTYSVTSGKTLFVGGLARLDLLYSRKSVRLTVFAADSVPITIVETVDAAAVYRNYLGTALLGVPFGGVSRLQHWPVLAPCNLSMIGIGNKESCADVVLSSAGWIAVTGNEDDPIDIRGWTPGGRGIYLRQPAILPYSVTLKGDRIRRSPAYKPHKLFIPRRDI